jgi:hypothetical protein
VNSRTIVGVKDAPRALGSDDAGRRYAWRSLFVFVPKKGDQALDALDAELRGMNSPRVAVLFLLAPGATPPSIEQRAQLLKIFARNRARVAASCFLIDGTGFFASTFLSVGAGMVRQINAICPSALFQESGEAVAFLALHTSEPPADITAALAAIRAG